MHTSLRSCRRVAVCLMAAWLPAAVSAGAATDRLPVVAMTSAATPSSPVDNAAFVPGTDALPASPIVGTLHIAQSAMQAMPALKGPLIGGRDARLFPALSLTLFSDGETLLPLQRGNMMSELPGKGARSYWTVIPQPGRVWR